MSTQCHCMKGLLSIAFVGLVSSLVGLNSRAADWIDENPSAVLRDTLPAPDDDIDPEVDVVDFGPFQSADDELVFNQEDGSLSNLDEDVTEADPASYRRDDQKRGDKKRRRTRGKNRGERLGRKGHCPFCQHGASDSPRHAYRDRGPHGRGPRVHSAPARGQHDIRREARMMTHRLTRLEHKVDMLLRMTHRAHVHQSQAYCADGGCQHCARGAKAGDGSGCNRCEGHASRGDRGHRHRDEAHDGGRRRRDRVRRHHHHDREGHPERRRHRPHRPAEWDAPPREPSKQADDDRSASTDIGWDEANEADGIDVPWHDDISVAESLERLERYFDDAFDFAHKERLE